MAWGDGFHHTNVNITEGLCSTCGGTYKNTTTGKCPRCVKPTAKDTEWANNELAEKRKRLLKEKELREINNHYFEG